MKKLNDNSDVPEARLGTLPQTCNKLKENVKATFYSPAEEWVLQAASAGKSWRKESLWWIPEASMRRVSKRDLISAELETLRTLRSPTMVMTASGEVLSKRRGNCIRQKNWTNSLTVMPLEETPASSSAPKFLWRSWGVLTTGPVKNHISPKRARELIAISQTMCHS